MCVCVCVLKAGCSFLSVVDRVDGDSVPMELLKQEVRNTLLNGAAIFFPDRQTRRNHLFTMMVIIYVKFTDSIPEVCCSETY